MYLFFDDNDISNLLLERKVISLQSYNDLFKFTKEKKQHKEQDIKIHRNEDNYFKIIIRCSKINQLDFSVILALGFYNSNQIFKLRRYNGKSHFHMNKIENVSFYNFHIHEATERYQQIGFREETFAVETSDYSDLYSAIKLMIKQCNIIIPEGADHKLF